ncbi:MAG: bacterial Ig-like domain-containing protein [Clostridia bacterium]|nr:bacterial Ig-like domain-containing protein [Clostridia bacterium]
MKRMMLIFMIIVCCCGIGYLGYLIFRSKNVDTVEIVGSIQTLYVVGDEIDFEDAKLKVTYKNGNIKMVNLKEKMVDYFSTSTEGHKVMNINYKSEVLKVEYNVIQVGAYYLNYSETRLPKDSGVGFDSTPKQYDIYQTPEMLYVGKAGYFRYYTRKSIGWTMADGNYDDRYSYTIVGDTMKIKTAYESYDIKVNYLENGIMQMVSDKATKIEGSSLVSKQEIKHFVVTGEMKTNQEILPNNENAEDGVKMYGTIENPNTSVVIFKEDERLKDLTSPVYLKVTYASYGIDLNTGGNHQFKTVYVELTDSMINGSYSTTDVFSTLRSLQVVYESRVTTMHYKVVFAD